MLDLTFLTASIDAATVLLTPLHKDGFEAWLDRQAEALARWTRGVGFAAEPGSVCFVSGDNGALRRVLVGIGQDEIESVWDWAALPSQLPEGVYRLDGWTEPTQADSVALGRSLGTYRFDRYRKPDRRFATLVWPDGCNRAEVERATSATFLVRDLINTPASDMGSKELAAAAHDVAAAGGARCSVIVGDDLLARNYPAVHAVGRASVRLPRLIDFVWGEESAPKVTLVGKGVCFDTGGLDIKPSSAMRLMKKDMGGAATVLGLAQMAMAAELPVRLRVLIPAVENSVSGKALRPLDVIATRKGPTVEIGNTDAEGRLILADALSEACSERPALLIDVATLTGAARVALGTELPALFSNNDALAEALLNHGTALGDPVWRMPLWRPYRRHIASKVVDLTNVPETPFAGAITATLFLAEFVEPQTPWAHLDVMGWNTESRPGQPEGGEAMGMRALYALMREQFGSG